MIGLFISTQQIQHVLSLSLVKTYFMNIKILYPSFIFYMTKSIMTSRFFSIFNTSYVFILFSFRWSIVLPLSWVKAFWAPLVSKGAHAIGLREKHWIACEVSLLEPFNYSVQYRVINH